ncbi:ATP-binding protein, partial [Nodularia chucula]|uniref:ATP-binding protein n=1 Tax=Nodularia chucula TaxID=3093667 RepID=UPI0039C620EF
TTIPEYVKFCNEIQHFWGKGTGLGLSISYQIIVDKHKGNLCCNSIPSEGTEFVIEIPIKH